MWPLPASPADKKPRLAARRSGAMGGDKHKKEKHKHKDKHKDKHKEKHHKHNKEKSHKRSRSEPEPSDSKRHRSSEPAEAAEAVLRRLIDASPKGAEDVRTLLSMLDTGEALLQAFRTAWARGDHRARATAPHQAPGGFGRGCCPMACQDRAQVPGAQ